MAVSDPFKSVLESLRAPVHDYKINTELLGQLNPNTISKELNLESLGNSRGEEEQPTSASAVFDDIESQIAERIGAGKKQASEIIENELLTYSSRISNLDFEGRFFEIRQAGPKAISDFTTEIELGLNEMHIERRKLKDIEIESEHFRKINGLEFRTAKVPTDLEQVLRSMLIVILVIIETYFNGTFLAKGNELGLLGGVFEAAGFAILNVGFSIILTGLGIRQLIHKKFVRKLFGIVSLILFLVVTLTINVALAHYREVSSTLLEGAGTEVVSRMWANPLGLTEIESWELLGIGMLFALITSIDVLFFKDVYPSYSSVQQKLNVALSNYKQNFQESLEELEKKKELFHDTIMELNSALSKRYQELDVILANRQRLSAIYLAHHEQLQRTSDALYSIYYSANQSARKTPAPKRFNKQSKVPAIKLSTELLKAGGVRKIEGKIDSTKKYLDEQMSEIHKAYDAGLKKYKNLDILFEEQASESS
jgi:hypothetical protein